MQVISASLSPRRHGLQVTPQGLQGHANHPNNPSATAVGVPVAEPLVAKPIETSGAQSFEVLSSVTPVVQNQSSKSFCYHIFVAIVCEPIVL